MFYIWYCSQAETEKELGIYINNPNFFPWNASVV